MCLTTVYTINRLPYAILDSNTSYQIMFGEHPSLSHLLVTRARSFIRHEKYRRGLDDGTWEEGLIGYSKHSKAYHIYNTSTR